MTKTCLSNYKLGSEKSQEVTGRDEEITGKSWEVTGKSRGSLFVATGESGGSLDGVRGKSKSEKLC